MRPAGTAEAGVVYPPVFVVDGQAGYPLPANPVPRRRGTAIWPLYLLLSLALCGMVVEACFIYHLYTSTGPPGTASDVERAEKISQDKQPVKGSDLMMKPSKPTAHLTIAPNLSSRDGVLLWNTEGNTIAHELAYKHGGLEVQKEGYYFIYSKVFFREPTCKMFTHTVLRSTPRYLGDVMELMESRRVHCHDPRELQSSYLGGVFHLVKGDTVQVKAKNHSLIARQHSYDNFFGMYMI
ncbi:tumor necrosis factor ligand superfamily member 14 [Conger conger]|uniref:tumor necrosis factor ligand superfamily member 14 n=1 Tax=Conger conger TaxID=82655 RepID=UPI002A59FFE4|nr:tumor necrosis factor ligand superfamily member 14 [Conger conger]